jgi:alpha-1,2-mannosyltransferase
MSGSVPLRIGAMTNLMMARRWALAGNRPGWPVVVFLGSASVMLVRALAGGKLLPFLPARGFGFFDLKIYREAARVTLDGGMLYAAKFQLGFGFTYPPMAALMFLILGAFPLRADEIAVLLLNIGLVAVLTHLTVRLGADSAQRRDMPRARPGAAWIAGAVALWTEPVISAIGYGQIDLLIAVLVLADITLGRHSRWAGLGIGAAAALKLTPLVFIPYLAFTGRGQMAARALGGFLLSIVISFVVVPWNAWSYWGGALFNTSRVTGHHPFAGRGPANQSLRGALMRIASGIPHLGDVWLLTCAIVGGLGLWLAARAGARGDEAWGFVLTAITGLLICPVSWTHHWAIAIPGLLLLLVFPRPGLSGRAVVAVAAVGAVGSPAIWLVIGGDPSGAHLGVGGLLLGDLYVLLGLVTILTAGMLELRRTRPQAVRELPRPGVPRISGPASPYPGHPGVHVRAVPTSEPVVSHRQSSV